MRAKAKEQKLGFEFIPLSRYLALLIGRMVCHVALHG